MEKTKFFSDVITVWGKVEDIKPLLAGLKGVKITGSGMDSHDLDEPVVEISFDSLQVNDWEIFNAISNPETGVGGLANSVGRPYKERG